MAVGCLYFKYMGRPKNGIDQDEVRRIEKRLRADGIDSQIQNALTASQLSRIYRSAKRPEELLERDALRQKRYEKRIPRFSSLKISFIVTVLFVAVGVFFANIEAMWLTGQMAGVSLSFSLAVLMLFAVYLSYGYIDRILYLKGVSGRMFVLFLVPILLLSIGVGFAVQKLAGSTSVYVFIATAATTFFFGCLTLLLWAYAHRGDERVGNRLS